MAVWNRKRMSRIQIAAIILAVSGTYLIATKGNPVSMDISAKGLIFGILAAIGVVIYTLLSRPIIGILGKSHDYRMGNVDWWKCTFFLDQGVDFPDKSGASSLDHHCSYCYYWHSSWFFCVS